MSGASLRAAQLGGRPLLSRVASSMVDLERERTIRGAASVTMTLRDSGLHLLRDGVLAPGTILAAWNQTWRLVGIESDEERATRVVFESTRIHRLKQDKRRLKMTGTRPAFARTIAQGVSPKVPVRFPDQSRSKTRVEASRGFGSKRPRIRGKAASREQVLVLEAALNSAVDAGASVRVLRALVAAMIVQSNVRNLTPLGSHRGGVLALGRGVGPKVDARSVRAVSEWFVKTAKGSGTPQLLAGRVLHRGAPNFAPFVPQAAAIVREFLNGENVTRIAQASKLVRKQLTERIELGVGAPHGEAGESRWDALPRVFEELGWYVYEDDAGLVVVSGHHARSARPVVTLSPDDPGVVSMSMGTDEGFVVDTVSASLDELKHGSIGPGMVVEIANYGEANGRYIVAVERRVAESRIVQVELERPARVVAGGNQSDGRGSTSLSDAPSGVQRAYDKAHEVAKKKWGYSWGGGHGSFQGPYDCSGLVSALLNAGGALSVPQTTVGLANVGKSGKGRFMTFYVKNTGDPRRSHCYAVFHVGGKDERIEAGGQKGALTGWRSRGSDAGYSPRHFDGW